MEAAIYRYAAVQLFFIVLAESLKNACNEVQLQLTTCLFTKNELFYGYFLRIHVSFLLHFNDLIVIWRTPLLVKQLSTGASK